MRGESASGMYRCFLQRATSPRSGNINNLLDTCSGKIHALLGRKAMTNLDSILKSRDVTDKGPPMDMLEDLKESWGLKNWCLWAVVLEKTLESLLDCKEIKLVNPKGNQSWIFIGRTDAEAENPIVWPPDVKNDSLEKTLILGKIEGRRRKGWQKMRWLDGFTDLMGMSLSKLRNLVMDREAWHAIVYKVTKSQTWLSNWTELLRASQGFPEKANRLVVVLAVQHIPLPKAIDLLES